MTSSIRPMHWQISDAAIEDLRARLRNTRFPDEVNDAAWSYGVSSAFLRQLIQYWAEEFDWRAAEARLRAVPQFEADIDGLKTHFLYVRSPHRGARPLMITHGWPGSVVEFLRLIPMLVEPERFGGKPSDAFDVVAPSLPGHGFSQAARIPGMSPRQIARRHAKLMAMLGYEQYIAQGGDWGSFISCHTALIDPGHCAGLHINMLVPVAPKDVKNPMALVAPEELPYIARAKAFRGEGFGYYAQQSTKPQTLGYALHDSPAGWCAWVAEKFHFWSDCAAADGTSDFRRAVPLDDFLTNLSLYWFTGTMISASRLYREQAQADIRGDERFVPISTPAAVAVFPHDIMNSPRQWAERLLTNIVQWDVMGEGGHFAAMEKPLLLAESLWRFKPRVFADA
jgi:microsomal epoxide hydrolase